MCQLRPWIACYCSTVIYQLRPWMACYCSTVIYQLRPWMACYCSTVIYSFPLSHWNRMTHTCISKITIIGSDNGLSPGQCQAIFWTNAGILSNPGNKFQWNLNEIHTFSLKEMHLKMPFAKWLHFCQGLNVLLCYLKSILCIYKAQWSPRTMRAIVIDANCI